MPKLINITISRPFHALSLLVLCISYTINRSFAGDTRLKVACSNSSYAPNSSYEATLNVLFSSLARNATEGLGKTRFFNTTVVGYDHGLSYTLYGLYLCRGDDTNKDCRTCVPKAIQSISQDCPNRPVVATIWYVDCIVRYSNESIFGMMDPSQPLYIVQHENMTTKADAFNQLVGKAMQSLATEVAKSAKKYATKETVYTSFWTVYAEAQCTPDLSASECQRCLTAANNYFPVCCSSSKGAILMTPSCNSRYELYPFYKFAPSPSSPLPLGPPTIPSAYSPRLPLPSTLFPSAKDHGLFKDDASPKKAVCLTDCARLNKPIASTNQGNDILIMSRVYSSNDKILRKRKAANSVTIALVALISLLVVQVSVCIYLMWNKGRKRLGDAELQNQNQVNRFPSFDCKDEELMNIESLQYDLEILQIATNNFFDDNKLGEGGFGGVYKGTLPNGQEIAVKRLSVCSNQGVEQFMTEVVFVAKLQHRNLVRLLGFCLAEHEKLLVYEYVPNKSLDYILYDPRRREELDWQTRYKIISGIARGMLYLHEDSRLKIVHRDLKASNILLDADMNPKISDFGTARHFNVDESQGNTSRIAGTFGYMAPEYLLNGEFSLKSDVYSFGVLVLEIVSGRKSTSFRQSRTGEQLLTYVWKLWSEGHPLEVVDTVLDDSYTRNEVIRCIQIGLLCVQGDAENRPTMASVVISLNSDSDLPTPQQPGRFIFNNFELLTDESTSKPMRLSFSSVTSAN